MAEEKTWEGLKWNKVEASNIPAWKPEEGDEVMGLYVEKREGIGPNNSNMYYLEKKDGEKIGVWGCAFLDNRFMNIHLGEVVNIKYLGIEKNPKTDRNYKNFDVFNADPAA